MNQDGGTTEQSSDYETSDANTSSLNNSLSEEEFSIESSNIDSGGLKLTISCRKRSCEDEQDSSAGAHLNQQKDHSRSRAKHLNMEKEISEMNCTNEDYLQNSDSHKELPKSGHSYSDHPSYNEGGRLFMAPTMSPSRSSKGGQQKAPSSNECQNSALFVSTQNDSSTAVFKSGTQLEVSKGSDVFKGLKRFKQEGSISISSLHDSHEPLLRLDTLPNVSPDSGIISLDESPFGSESPNSFVNGDCSADLQHGPHSSFTSTSQHLHKRTVTVDNLMKQNSVEEGKEHNGHSTGELSEQEGVKATAVDLTKELTKIGPSKESDMDCCTDEDVVSSPVIANGSGVILSSPHKISQTMGRKKRGRPPKQKKSLLLRHKRSTIYSGLYGAIPIVPHSDYKNPSSADIHGGSFKKVSEILNGKPGQVTAIVKSADIEEVNDISCDSTSFKKRSPGRPKGSVSKKSTNTDVFRHAYKNVSLKSKTVNLKVKNNIGSKFKKDVTKRPRGRPRKTLVPTDSHSHHTLDNSDCHKGNSKLLVNDDTIVNNKSVRKKHFRKRVFTQKKRKPHIFKTSNNVPNQIIQKAISNPDAVDKNKINSAGSLKLELSVPDSNPDKRMHHGGLKAKPHVSPEKSVFQDNDLDALLKSVKSSITSQFTNEDPGSDIIGNISFVNPFKVSEPSPFPKMTRPESPKVVKPKSKKPKLHVMMRRTKRKKRKKLPANRVVPPTPPPPKKLNIFSAVEPLKKIGKFSVVPQKKTGTFGSPTSEKRLSFFTSCVQPSKILATSRLNVFRSGTGVDEAHRSGTPTDTDQPDCFDKRGKRRHRLLYRKSKHKNIIDPVFAADLDTLVSGLNGMFLSENPADNYIRVRPGEMPLPSIFRVIKIDVNKKTKDRIPASEMSILDRNKPRKETPSPYDSPAASFKPISKVGRKKSFSDQVGDQRELSSISDSSDQWLPPKKRHRLVNLESTQFSSPLNYFDDSASLKKDLKMQRKGKRLRKTLCNEDNKYVDKSALGRFSKNPVSLELTIDTSSYSTGGSSVCVSSLSPCPSRLSTRSSTLPSLSSPSPSGSPGLRSRIHSKNNFPLACPLHSLSCSATDRSSCPECQLLEQSISPVTLRSCRATLRSLSAHASESNYLSEHPASSSEPSPVIKEALLSDRVNMRNARKRRKSVNISAEESDTSPPRLEKTTCLSPMAHRDSSFFSEPPEITNSPFKSCVSPRRQNPSRFSNLSPNSLTYSPLSPRKKPCSNVSPPKNLRALSPTKITPQTIVGMKTCNKAVPSSVSSTSVIKSLCSEHDPLPIEHCSKRTLVEEIKAALACENDDETSSSDESTDPSPPRNAHVPSQLPRKRFQRVGLFSDFYKDDEPRKRCENMIRCRDKLLYVKEEHEYGLIPPPLHIGEFYMKLVQNFQLPYDIWWQHMHQQLPKKPEPKIKFRTIRTNVYSDSKVSARKLEIPLCNCVVPPESVTKGCLDDCLNRMIYTECTPSTCALGENCDNQKIQKHEWVPGLEKFLTKDRGFGVRTKTFVKNGQFILEYLGEVVSEAEFRRRMMEEYSEECHHYALHLDSGSVIDGYRMGNIGRYVNHSCKPNCEMQKWNVNGLYRMVLFALRDIEEGEELSYDYNFDPFNQETQQECRCGSSDCRGVIGGKTQRNGGSSNKPEKLDDSKDKRKSKLMNKKLKEKQSSENVQVQPLAKPMTFKERCYARKHRTFLVRNVDKVRNQRHPGQDYVPITKEEMNVLDCNKINALNPDMMLVHLNERSVKTRLAAYAKDNPEMARRHQLAQIFDKMLTELLSLKDEDGNSLVTQLMSLPSRKKQPQYYQVVREPIDLSMIKQRVKTGYYDHLSSFNADIMLLFSNVELYCGPKSDMGQIILKLRRVLNCVKTDVANQIDDLLGPKTTKSYMDAELERLEHVSSKASIYPEEDIIRCICGVTRDEGLMLQCEKCMRWQHCDCVRASGKEEHYLCDRCEPRYYDPEILLNPSPPDAMPDCTHYMTLLKDDVQYAVGDCVYVMRDCKRTPTGTPLRSSHRLMASVNPEKLDVFRLEQLWKDPKGERFASGTPYLRPQETFHEPTRKFYHNELFRTPNFEIIPMDLVMGKCIVMDPNTYCKGRPKGVKEQDIYICEYRVDKTAHLFHKIQKIWYPINTSRFCFDWFDKKLNIRRTFLPHEVPEEYKRRAERNMTVATVGKVECVKQEEKIDTKKSFKFKMNSMSHGKVKIDESIRNDFKLKAEVKVNVKKGGMLKKECAIPKDDKFGLLKIKEVKKKEKKQRLDKILTKLLNNIPGKQRVDLTYLLEEGKRLRRKVTK